MSKKASFNYSPIHNKIIRHSSNDWRVIVAQLGANQLVECECLFGTARGQRVDIKTSRSPLSSILREYAQKNLVH